MKKIVLMAAMLCASLPFVEAQESPSGQRCAKVILTGDIMHVSRDTMKVAPIKVYGFVRNYLNYDSRQMLTVCGGEYLLIPRDEDWNLTEEEAAALSVSHRRFDRNADPQTHLLALSTRFGLALNGPQVLGAKASGRVEGDFAGFGDKNTVLRLRLAYLNLEWKRHTLLVGQDWHPLSGNIMPEVLGMAAGAPFRPHSRTPQVRWSYSPLKHWSITTAALWQYQYTSPGPDGESASYANRTLLPELFLGLSYRNEHIYTQLGADYTRLTIRQEVPVVSSGGTTPLYSILLTNSCQSLSPTFYFQYTWGLFALKMRSTLASNLAHLNMLSGYAAVTTTGNEYMLRPVRSSVSYLNFAYGRKWRADLFLGYQYNLGLGEEYTVVFQDFDNLYMKKDVKNIHSLWRVAPSLSYNTKAFNIGLEYEWTAVNYGDINHDATVTPKRQVDGHRLCLLVKYNF